MTTNPAAIEPTPRRPDRWRSLSLRAMMVLVLLVGAPLGWLARRARLQRQAVAAVVARGGRVMYDWALSDVTSDKRPPKGPPGPAWLRRIVGDEFLQEVGYVRLIQPATADDLELVAGFDHLRTLAVGDLLHIGSKRDVTDDLGRLARITTLKTLTISGPDLSDEMLAPVGRLTGLDTLHITGTAITDTGLLPLTSLTALTYLGLNECPRVTGPGVARLIDHLPLLDRLQFHTTPIDDAALPAIGRLPHLKSLNLARTSVTDVGLAALAGASRFETLQLRSMPITDAGLTSLAGLAALKRFILSDTRIIGPGLVYLSRMANLTELDLSGTPINDAGLRHLAPLRKLRVFTANNTGISDAGTPDLARLIGLELLYLSGTRITDAGLLPLAGLPKLTVLNLTNTLVTAEGEAEFRRLRPAIRIFVRGKPVISRGQPGPVGPPFGNPAAGSTPARALRPESGPSESSHPSAVPAKGNKVGSTSDQAASSVLGRLKDAHRPVVVFAPTGDDAKLTRQRHSFVGALPEAGIKDRDIVVVEIVAGGESKAGADPITPEEAAEIRKSLGVADDAFAVVLVGRDGGAKDRWDEPVSSQEIFGKIDAMPMRQQEVQEKGGGSE